jgi:CheY-like chemotaxis protein
MHDQLLQGCRILLVEDEYLLADDLSRTLEHAGATILGPTPSVKEALSLLASEPAVDGAVLDVNLYGEMVFPVADALKARDIPFLFTTGYDQGAVPSRFAEVTRCEKPVSMSAVTRAMQREIRAQA